MFTTNYLCLLFFLGISNFKNGVYCQQCGYVIWISLQSSQFCTACGFGVHYTCMDNIMRTCVALKVKSQPDFIMDICPERILPQLKYRQVYFRSYFPGFNSPNFCPSEVKAVFINLDLICDSH